MPESKRTARELQKTTFALVPDLPGYCVGSDGSVWSCKQKGRYGGLGNKWRRMKIQSNVKSGYMTVDLGGKGYYLHILILLTFVGPCPEGMECRHLDDDRTNNTLDNLCWGTHGENYRDAERNGRRGVGENHQCAKLTEAEVLEAIKLRKEQPRFWTYKRLGSRYRVHFNTIMLAVKGVNWGHLQ